jgi:hypothetical protein
MLKNLDQIRECYLRAEKFRRWAATASPPSIREDYFSMERRWLSLARGYEFAKQLDSFTAASRYRRSRKQRNGDSR